MSDPDRQAYGQQELSGEEPGSCGDSRLHVHHLLGQNWHPHPEQDDGRSYVV